MNDATGAGGALFCEDLATVSTADGAEDEQAGTPVPASNNEAVVVTMEQSNAGTTKVFNDDVSRCADLDVVGDECVIDQPSPMGGLKVPTDDSDSGYETMDMNGGQGQEETRNDADDAVVHQLKNRLSPYMTQIPELQHDGEAETSTSGINNIGIYRVCCSQKVENTAKLKNRLCEDCDAVTEDTEGDETIVVTVSMPCAQCTKRFEKSVVQTNQMCNECISIVMRGYETDLGVNRYIAGCMCCQRPFTQPIISLTCPTMCPQWDYVVKASPSLDVNTPEPMHVEGNLRWTDVIAIQCCAAITVKIYLRKHFYKWCDGHRSGSEEQKAHQCLEPVYAVTTLCRLCYMMSPCAIVTLIKTLAVKTGVKVGKGAAAVVNKTLWGIHGSKDPLSTLRQSSNGCPPRVRTLVEKAVRSRGNRLYQNKYRDHFLITPRKLVGDN